MFLPLALPSTCLTVSVPALCVLVSEEDAVGVCVRVRAAVGSGAAVWELGEVKDLSGPERVLAGAVSRALLRPPCLEGRLLQGQEEQAPAPQDAATGRRLWRGRGGTCWEKPGQQVRERANEPRRRWPGPLAPRVVDPCSCDSRDASQHCRAAVPAWPRAACGPSARLTAALVSHRERSEPAATAGCQPGRASLSAVPAAPSVVFQLPRSRLPSRVQPTVRLGQQQGLLIRLVSFALVALCLQSPFS